MPTKTIAIVILAIVVIAGAVYGGFWAYKHYYGQPQPTPGEIEVPVEGLGEIAELPGTQPTGEFVFEEAGEQPTAPQPAKTPAKEAPSGEIHIPEATPETTVAFQPEIPEKTPSTPQTREIIGIDVTPKQPIKETRPVTAQPVSRPAVSESVEIETFLEPTPTPVPEVSLETPTPVPTSAPAPGNYSVHTIEPVLESKLAEVRKAMQTLGVSLKEEKTYPQFRIDAYRIAVGYFRTKAEAESWARYNFRPKGIKYYIYPVQGMYSLQVGIYTRQENIESAIRELYQKYQGGRLPIRTEATMIATPAYTLSINKITPSLARKIQDELFRLGIQSELTGI